MKVRIIRSSILLHVYFSKFLKGMVMLRIVHPGGPIEREGSNYQEFNITTRLLFKIFKRNGHVTDCASQGTHRTC